MEKYIPNEKDKTSGLDMKKTLDWYGGSKIEMPQVPEIDLPCPIENKDLIELSEKELGGLFSMFPENARNRSIMKKVIGKPSAWFHKNSTNKQPQETHNQIEALSPTAIVPSYIDYNKEDETKELTANVYLYKIPKDIVSEKIRKIVLAQGFIHEIGHSIVQPLLYEKNHTLKFPNGKKINGYEAMMHFAKLAEQHPPISDYSSTYRGDNNKFESNDPDYNKKIPISEEMSEALTADVLGFTYCNDESRRKNPFADRPEIKKFIQDFLNAELLKK